MISRQLTPLKLPSWLFLIALFHVAGTAASETSFAQTSEMAHWKVGIFAADADLSPDDRLLAVTTAPAPQRQGAEVVESVELWDYRQHQKTASTELAKYPTAGRDPNPVRFTHDGLLLVAADPTKVHVLSAATLKTIRVIAPVLPHGFRIFTLETSPLAHVVLISASGGSLSALLFAYDLDTGQLLLRWESSRWVEAITWKPDGLQFAIATQTQCTSIQDNLHVFSASSWTRIQTLTVKYPQSLAFSNDRLFSVQSSRCRGTFHNRRLGIESFDVHDWKQSDTVFLPDGNIHDSLSFANGRLLADTGRIDTHFDWLDAVSWSVEANLQFTVWADSAAQSTIFRSQPFTADKFRNSFRLSRTGRMVLLNPENPEVYELPALSNTNNDRD